MTKSNQIVMKNKHEKSLFQYKVNKAWPTAIKLGLMQKSVLSVWVLFSLFANSSNCCQRFCQWHISIFLYAFLCLFTLFFLKKNKPRLIFLMFDLCWYSDNEVLFLKRYTTYIIIIEADSIYETKVSCKLKLNFSKRV